MSIRLISPRFPELRRPCLMVCLPILAALSFGCTSDEEKLQDFMQKGDGYREAEQYKEAIIEYKNVLQIDPNVADAHRALAESYLKSGQLREGYWELSETVRLAPDDVDSRISYATISIAAKNFDEVLEQADVIVELAPENATGHLIRGQALASLERLDEVEAELMLATELKPDDSSYRMALATYYGQVEEFDKAERELKRALETDAVPLAHFMYANLLMIQERYDGVEGQLKAAIALALEPTEDGEEHADLVRAYANLASFYFDRERVEEGAATFELGIEKVEEGKKVLSDALIRQYRIAGENEKADELLERSTAFDSTDPAPWLALSTRRGREGDLQGALEAAEKAIEANPEKSLAKLRHAELLIDLGVREGNDAKVQEGRKAADAVRAEDPSDAEAAFVLGKAEIAAKEYEAAIESLREATALKPDWGQAHFVLGSALLMGRDLQRSRAELARAVELSPGLSAARRLLVQVHAGLGEHEYAIENGRRYLAQKPDDDEARIQVAQSMVRLSMYEDAAEVLAAVPEERRGPSAHFAIGRVAMAQGNLEEARKALMLATVERPHDPEILNSLLSLDSAVGQIDQAVDRIDAALIENPEAAALWHVKGLASIRSGEVEEAERAFKKAVEFEPEGTEAYNQLARIYAGSGRLDKAISQYREAIDRNPENVAIRHFLGVLYEMTGESAKAGASYESALERDGNLPETKNNLAFMMAVEGRDLDRALKLAQEAKAAMPDNANAADTLGWVLYKRGVTSAAIGYLREALGVVSPDNPIIGEIRLHLSEVYDATGESDKALETLQAALSDLEKLRISGRLPSGAPDPGWADRVRAEIERLQESG